MLKLGDIRTSLKRTIPKEKKNLKYLQERKYKSHHEPVPFERISVLSEPDCTSHPDSMLSW